MREAAFCHNVDFVEGVHYAGPPPFSTRLMLLSLRLIARRFVDGCQRLRSELDKRRHFSISTLLVLVFWACGLNLLEGVALGWLIGLGKEIWDRYYGSGFCWFDMAANVVGLTAGVLLILIL